MSDEPKFKIGDRVVLCEDSEYVGYSNVDNSKTGDDPLGVVGTVVDNYSYRVNWDNGQYNYYNEKDLKIPRIKDTKIARKMNKGKYKEAKDGWIYF